MLIGNGYSHCNKITIALKKRGAQCTPFTVPGSQFPVSSSADEPANRQTMAAALPEPPKYKYAANPLGMVWQDAEEAATRQVRLWYVIKAIADAEKIEVESIAEE